jgi:hypothetical protein
MANPHARNLIEKAQSYARLEVERDVRKDLGVAGFGDLSEDFQALKSFAERISKCSWDGIPAETIDHCFLIFSGLDVPMTSIRTFDILHSKALKDEQARIISEFSKNWKLVFETISPQLCYCEITTKNSVLKTLGDLIMTYRNDNESQLAPLTMGMNELHSKTKVLTDQMAEILKKIQFQYEPTLEELKKSVNESDVRLKNLTETEAVVTTARADAKRVGELVLEIERKANEGGITKQAQYFDQLAIWYRRLAIGWAIVGVLAGFGLWYYVDHLEISNSVSGLDLIRKLTPRLITVTLISTGVVFCIRNFSAMMHNQIVNRHRQTALTTFKIFVDGTEDPAVKNAVLLQSTQAIFAPQPTGYLKGDPEMPQVNQVTEIVRGLAGKGKHGEE